MTIMTIRKSLRLKQGILLFLLKAENKLTTLSRLCLFDYYYKRRGLALYDLALGLSLKSLYLLFLCLQKSHSQRSAFVPLMPTAREEATF